MLSPLSRMLITPHRLEKELARLQRNKERRFAREKQKGIAHGSTENGTAESVDSPNSAGATSGAAAGGNKPVGTQRKCANCGQVGHIKTNKKCGLTVSFDDDPPSFSFQTSSDNLFNSNSF